MEQDRYGLPLSTASSEAAQAYRDGIDLLLSFWPGAAEAFDLAVARDPDLALAHAARARIHAVYQQRDAAFEAIGRAKETVARRGTPREQSHVAALALVISGSSTEALTSALAHLESWPRDALILSLPLGAFGLYAFSGRADHDRARVDLCRHHAPAYGDDWWFLGNLGWALTEAGALAQGRAITEHSFALRRNNAHAVHGLLHAMFEDGSLDEADRLVESWISGYDRSGMLYGHIAWHQALGALDRGDTERALAIHTDMLTPAMPSAPPLNALSDGASLLWRLAAEGHAIPAAAWTDVGNYARNRFAVSGLPFVEMHLALIAAATHNNVELAERLGALEQRLAGGKLAAGPIVPRMVRALQAFADGKYDACVDALAPVIGDLVRIGGSHAQREVIEDTYILALIRSGALAQARTVLDARLHRRPSARDGRWRTMTLE